MNPVSRFVHRSLARYFWRCAQNLQDELLDHCLAQQAKIDIFQHRAAIHADLGSLERCGSLDVDTVDERRGMNSNIVELPRNTSACDRGNLTT